MSGLAYHTCITLGQAPWDFFFLVSEVNQPVEMLLFIANFSKFPSTEYEILSVTEAL